MANKTKKQINVQKELNKGNNNKDSKVSNSNIKKNNIKETTIKNTPSTKKKSNYQKIQRRVQTESQKEIKQKEKNKTLKIDNKVIVLPNGTLSNSTIVNYSSMKERRLDLKIAASYNDNTKKVKKILEEVILKNSKVIKDKEILIALDECGDDSLNYIIQLWVKASDYLSTKYELLENIKNKFDEEGISIPYKQLDVHLIK